MDANAEKALRIRIRGILKNYEERGFNAAFVADRKEALSLVKTIVEPSSFTARGGSMTLEETGIGDYLRSETDFHAEYADAYRAKWYLSSVSAFTENGELYFVDGRNNRVSAVLYGPENVVLVAGINKLRASLSEAEERVRKIAAPANAIRLCRKTPCAEKGECIAKGGDFGKGCLAEESICSSSVVIRRSSPQGRISLIVVGESLGY